MTTENEQQGSAGNGNNAGDIAGDSAGGSTSGGAGKLFLFVLLLLGASVAFQKLRPQGGGESFTGAPVPLPPLMVEGWLNTTGEVPTNESLAGKLVVIDAWATWCGPCRAAMPGLVEVHGRWADKGVAFLGMTSESGDKIEAIQSFADKVPGFDWPIAYGSREVWNALGIEVIPTLILFGKDGVRVWQGHSLGALEAEIEKRVL